MKLDWILQKEFTLFHRKKPPSNCCLCQINNASFPLSFFHECIIHYFLWANLSQNISKNPSLWHHLLRVVHETFYLALPWIHPLSRLPNGRWMCVFVSLFFDCGNTRDTHPLICLSTLKGMDDLRAFFLLFVYGQPTLSSRQFGLAKDLCSLLLHFKTHFCVSFYLGRKNGLRVWNMVKLNRWQILRSIVEWFSWAGMLRVLQRLKKKKGEE